MKKGQENREGINFLEAHGEYNSSIPRQIREEVENNRMINGLAKKLRRLGIDVK